MSYGTGVLLILAGAAAPHLAYWGMVKLGIWEWPWRHRHPD